MSSMAHPQDIIQTEPQDMIQTEIGYFSRDVRYDTEKPYTTSFPVEEIPGAKTDNHDWEFHSIRVKNVRHKVEPELDVHGFQFVKWETALSRHDFDDDAIVASTYYSELAEMLNEVFPRYKKLLFFDHTVRKRDPRYPDAKGAPTTNSQPFRFAHVDFTEHGARLRLAHHLGGRTEEYLKSECDMLNVWRLLNTKPTEDWPLAFCDSRSVNPIEDLIANDVVFQTGVGENCFLRHNISHEWWYLNQQHPSEVAVFRNTAVGNPSAARAFHCAFRNTLSASQEMETPRESVEVRVAAFY